MAADYELLDAASSKSSIWHQKGKLYILVFILFLIINSQVFINQVIDRITGTTDFNKNTTNKGVIVQSTIFVILFIIIDILISQNWL
jgi:hypothetical protein